jgi:hypothetical protein
LPDTSASSGENVQKIEVKKKSKTQRFTDLSTNHAEFATANIMMISKALRKHL